MRPPHRLTVAIGVPDAGPPWELSVALTAAGGRTVLEFRQVLAEGFSPADAGSGWHWYLDRLGAVLAGGAMPDWTAHEAATAGLYPR